MRKIRSKHNDLLNYFLHDEKYLSKKYVNNCKKFFKDLKDEQKTTKQSEVVQCK